jgi:putative LysE/RhtB family amino acid efflux pump
MSPAVDSVLAFAHGALAGLVVTAPPGPIGALCVRRTTTDGPAAGLATASGALAADVAYAAVAAFGLAGVVVPEGPARRALGFAAAAVLCWTGVRALTHVAKRDEAVRPTRTGLVGLAATTFALGLVTPGTLPAFAVMFARLDAPSPPALVAGVLCGASAWWLTLCFAAHRLRDRVGAWRRGMEYACGALLVLGGFGAAWSGWTS